MNQWISAEQTVVQKLPDFHLAVGTRRQFPIIMRKAFKCR